MAGVNQGLFNNIQASVGGQSMQEFYQNVNKFDAYIKKNESENNTNGVVNGTNVN